MPGAKLEFVGIRPGEKLHEMMISKDDARMTLELDDRYLIEPLFEFWERDHYEQYALKRVDEDFCYASDTNTEWLGVTGIRELLQQVKVGMQ